MTTSTRWLIASAGIVLLIAGAHVSGQQPRSADSPAVDFRNLTAAQAEALQRRIEQTIIEQGTVESADVLELHSQAPGDAVVISTVPDGGVVKEGDLLVALDDSAVRQELLKQQIAVKQAQADVEYARITVESARRRSAVALPAAELALKAAKLARSRYLGEEGEYESQFAEADRTIVLARKRLEMIKRRAESAKPSGGAASDDGAQLAIAEAQTRLDASLAAKQLLTRHVHPHQTAVLELGVLRAESELQQAKDSADAEQRAVEAELQTAEAKQELAERRLEELEQQVRHYRIHAPRDGVVIHAVSSARRSTTAGLEPGATVHEGQLLIKMPDLDRPRVRVRVHESQIARVKRGQGVSLRLDAFPSRTFRGKVTEISSTPEPSQWFNQDIVEYGVLVEVSSPPPGMKVGMTAAAEFDVSSADQQR